MKSIKPALKRSLPLFILIITFLVIPYNVQAGPPTNDLFTDAPVQLDLNNSDDPTIIRSRLVTVNFGLLGNATDAAPDPLQVNQTLLLNLFDDVVLTALLDQVKPNENGGYAWIGHLQDKELSQVILLVEGGVMAGSISSLDALYQVRYVEQNIHAIYQIDRSAFPPHHDPLPVDLPEDSTLLAPDQGVADSGTRIDIMVLYTPEARTAAGGNTTMRSMINLAVSETNVGYANSGVIQRVNLVHTGEINYSEVNFDWFLTLSRLTATTDGYMENVHTLRDTYRADLVILIVNHMGYCGLGWLMTYPTTNFAPYGFSMVSRICTVGNYTLAHEMGHNMGSHHDRANSGGGQGAYPYSYGYQAPNRAFRTIMAYNCPYGCPRVNYWSNPDIFYGGQPMGVFYTDPTAADNRMSLNNTALYVANFRVSSPPLPPANLQATDGVFTNMVRITWNNVPGATGYTVYRANSSNGSRHYLGYTLQNGYSDYSAEAHSPYYYWVKANNFYGYSDYSGFDTGYRTGDEGQKIYLPIVMK